MPILRERVSRELERGAIVVNEGKLTGNLHLITDSWHLFLLRHAIRGISGGECPATIRGAEFEYGSDNPVIPYRIAVDWRPSSTIQVLFTGPDIHWGGQLAPEAWNALAYGDRQ